MIETIYQDMLVRFGDTLQKTSEDTSKSEYMTSSHKMVINFDRFKNDFVKDMALTQTPLSCDVLYMSSAHKLFLVEFKNGEIGPKENYEIKTKIFESLLMLLERTGETITFTRRNLTFILVYNETIPHGIKQFEDTAKNTLQNKIFNLAGSHIIRFGLHRFKKLYFYDVYTYSKTEFESEFVSQYCI
jgi:hypothetical protein